MHIARVGWPQFSLLRFCQEEHIQFYDLIMIMPYKEDFLTIALTWVDQAYEAEMTSQALSQDSLSPSEQIFEEIMTRLDILTPFRPALKDIKQALMEDLSGFSLIQTWLKHLYDHVPSTSPFSRITWVGLYIRVFWTWLHDDDTNAHTMKTLDEAIKKINGE